MAANKLLVVSGYVAAALGLAVVGLGLLPDLLGTAQLGDWLFWPGSGYTAQTLSALSRLNFVVTGGVLAGWGVSFALLARAMLTPAPTVDTLVVLRALAKGVVTWFVVDSAGSAWLGAWPNVVANLVLLGVLLGPLVALLKRGGVAARHSRQP